MHLDIFAISLLVLIDQAIKLLYMSSVTLVASKGIAEIMTFQNKGIVQRPNSLH